jgi:hypothetical protein
LPVSVSADGGRGSKKKREGKKKREVEQKGKKWCVIRFVFARLLRFFFSLAWGIAVFFFFFFYWLMFQTRMELSV